MQQLLEFRSVWLGGWRWAVRNPAAAVLLALIVATVVYFFGFAPMYGLDHRPVWGWAWARFLPEYNQEHSKLIPPLVLFLVWYHRAAIRSAPKRGSDAGLIFIVVGVLAFVVAARALQARVALFGFPFLVFGIVLYLWGREVARILIFPVALLFFMIPLGAIEQMTFRLQFVVVTLVSFLSRLFGVQLYAVGTSIGPASGTWGFEIAEGCSGIRSLIAMIMITAVYVHLREPKIWKKVTLLIFSVVFAILGNAARVFTIIVLAQLGFPNFAAGIYHDWSSQLLFFPVALLTMVGFHKLLNLNLSRRVAGEALKEREHVVYDY